MYASSYEIYDRISKPMQVFLEGLDATYDAPCKCWSLPVWTSKVLFRTDTLLRFQSSPN